MSVRVFFWMSVNHIFSVPRPLPSHRPIPTTVQRLVPQSCAQNLPTIDVPFHSIQRGTTFERFAEEILKHNGHPQAIEQVAIDMSGAYTKGVRENLANAAIVYDKFHVVALANGAVDEVRRDEAREGGAETKAQLKQNLWLWRKNPDNLTQQEQERMDQLDLKHLATGQAYQIRLELQSIYGSRTERKARERWEDWIGAVRRKADRFGALLTPMKRLADTVTVQGGLLPAEWDAGAHGAMEW